MTKRRTFPAESSRLTGQMLAFLAVFYLALVQMLSAAHAASGEGMAPDHDRAACVLHIAGDRSHAPIPASAAVIAEPPLFALALPIAVTAAPHTARLPLPPSRGPPSL